jgi:hypothetical protein
MLPRRHSRSWVWLVALVISTGVFLSSACSAFEPKPKYSPDEQAWVDKAIRLYGGQTEDARRHLLSYTTPTVIYLPTLVCVAFKLKPTAVGGEFTACFSKAKGTVEFTHTEGR